MKKKIDSAKPFAKVTLLSTLISVANIPINLIIASSLAQTVSAISSTNFDLCLRYAVIFGIFTIAKILLTFFSKVYLAKMKTQTEQQFKQSLYRSFMQGTSNLHILEPTKFTTIFKRDVEQIVLFYTNTLPEFITAGLGFVGYSLYICIALNGFLCWLFMILFGLLSLLQPIILEKFLIKNFIEADEAEAVLAQHLTSGMEGYATIKMLSLHKWFMEKYQGKLKIYWRNGVRASAAGTFNSTMTDMNSFLQTLGLVLVLGWAMLNQQISFTTSLQIYLLSSSIYSYITTLFQIKTNGATYQAASNQVKRYLFDEERTLKIRKAPQCDAAEICVSELSYKIADRSLISDASFAIQPGEKCLICGENGVGKSTLLSLFMGQVEPTKGKIFINGEEVLLGVKRLRNWIAYSPQAIPNVRCTAHELYENAALAQSNISTALLEKHTKEMGLSEDDLHKPITELSGGMQKKVLLCLALSKHAPLLLLDEPEAMLDQASIKKLHNILQNETRTILIVTHSKTFNNLADSIITISEQKIYKTA